MASDIDVDEMHQRRLARDLYVAMVRDGRVAYEHDALKTLVEQDKPVYLQNRLRRLIRAGLVETSYANGIRWYSPVKGFGWS